jgi:carbon starvation protein CstA
VLGRRTIALEASAWGTFTIGASIPLALFMGLCIPLPEGAHGRATIIGVAGLFLAVIVGNRWRPRPSARGFTSAAGS